MAADATHGLSPAYDSISPRSTPSSPAPIPHIDDLVAIPTDVGPNQSIKRLLEMAQTALRQSEISRDFNRPAIALQEYIRASVIAIQIITNHKDYPGLRTDHTDSARVHNALLRRIKQQSDDYESIKRDIIEDNKRSGVQPTVRRSLCPNKVQGLGLASKQADLVNGHALPPVNGSPGKVKPVVHPKPHALAGNLLPGRGRAASSNGATLDLAARFANLRGPQSSPGQDPRIKTYPIPTQRPAGPRQMPQDQQLNLDTDAATSSALPKVPDAIYSPARGSVSGDLARLPTSTSRGLFSRTGSSTSVPAATPQGSELAPAVVSPRMPSPRIPPRIPSPRVPEGADEPLPLPAGDGITPEQLVEVMRGNWSILLIDIRSREAFNEGHIMSSSIICIEPSILLRDNISSEEISESLVLSPSPEQALFEKRDSCDLVVFYDEDSHQVIQSPKNADEQVILSLHRALIHLNYGRDLKRPPRLLIGGLAAWADLVGPLALQSGASSMFKGPHARYKRNGIVQRRGSKYIVTSLQPADVKAWENTLEKDARQTATRPSFPRTGEEFLRFSPVSTQQQSMSSPPMASEQGQEHGLVHKFGSLHQLPAPPARPCAAVKRLSHSGLSQGDDGHEAYGETGAVVPPRLPARSKKAMEQLAGGVVKTYTGLNNPRNWCYANSTLQSLLASPGFGRELADSGWMSRYIVPRKAEETIDQPQLMIRIISHLFQWMSTGNFETLKAQTLMEYSRNLCKSSDPQSQFGGPEQQDAQEFMSFVMEQMHDETNSRRDRAGKVEQPKAARGRPLVEAAIEYWRNHTQLNQSIIDRYWRGVELSAVECMGCHTRTHTFSPFGWVPVTVGPGRDMTLYEALNHYVAENRLDDFACDHCQGKRVAMQSMSFARMPPLLCISFRRFNYDGRDFSKSNAAISWDFNDVDLSPYFLGADADSGGGDSAFTAPFRYECYAVIVHSGRQLNTGHYFAYVRDASSHDPYAWYCCNDSHVSKVRIGSGDAADVQKDVFRSDPDRVPYLVFFHRKDA
ncbi:hypothetical protein XA68_11888 [Ophiocordyceps unilateralis]|uniref:USP domain-containing protein n=1 Tax=Ophiocordyceps unilateralis TaxID=268505 RepID=A0A2A9PFW9_OPHUN|nr:hypothetical protein XA68_11888 [Ophiocordyceps unilateralis]